MLPELNGLRIPRWYLSPKIEDTYKTQLHLFVDASENGFAAVVYLRACSKDAVVCSLISAKTRVAPLKSLSIPRLELQATVLGARLARSIISGHSICFHEQYFWSDSMTVLSWLRSDHRQYRQFAAIRVSEILEVSNLRDWRWVPTKLNVADEGTKWQREPNFCSSSQWFTGPPFLKLSPELCSKEEPQPTSTQEELKAQFVGVEMLLEEISSILNGS